METERRIESTSTGQESEQQPLEVIPENTNRYEQAIEGLPLMGKRPGFILLDQEGEAYLRREDAAELAGYSKQHMHQLTAKKRFETVTPNGLEQFIHLNSFVRFLLYERRPRGRPRKNPLK